MASKRKVTVTKLPPDNAQGCGDMFPGLYESRQSLASDVSTYYDADMEFGMVTGFGLRIERLSE